MTDTTSPEDTPATGSVVTDEKKDRARPERVKPRKYNKMTPREIATVRALREKEGWTLEALGKHFKKHPSTIAKLLQRLGVKKGSGVDGVAAKIESKIEEEILTDALIRSRRIKDTREDTYRMSSMVQKLMVSEIVEEKKKGNSVGGIINNIKAYKEAMSALKLGQEVRFTSLGIKDGEDPDDENLPDLTLSELTPEEIAAIQADSSQGDMIDILGMPGDGIPSDDEDGVVIEGEDGDDD